MRILRICIASAIAAFGAPVWAREVPGEANAVQAFEICLKAVKERQTPAVTSAGDAIIRGQADGRICTFAVKEGDAEALRAAVIAASIARAFTPAKTRWDPGAFGARQTLCGPMAGRPLSLLISSGATGAGQPQLIATLLESGSRDPRCDRDLGLQPALSETLRR